MHGRRVSWGELGGVTDVEAFADQQVGPSCGFESIENVIQLYHPVSNSFSDLVLRPYAAAAGHVYSGYDGDRLEIVGYQKLLRRARIGSRWHRFNHELLIRALENDRVAIAIVDLNVLYSPWRYAPGTWHAITVTNLAVNAGSKVIARYVGIDSNAPGQECLWTWDALERATASAGPYQLLITTHPVRWGSRSKRYEILADGQTLITPGGVRTLENLHL